MTEKETTPFSITFESIEQLDVIINAMGWPTEYRQLEAGEFTSTFTILEADSWFLMEEQSRRTVEVQAPAPAGMYILAVVEGDPAAINGLNLTTDHILLIGPDSDFRATMPAGMKATQIGIAAEQFEEALRVIAPGLQVPRDGTITIATEPGQLANLKRAMRTALFTPSQSETAREETASRILAEFFSIAAASGETRFGAAVYRPATFNALNRAREYIEAHLPQTMRISAVCEYANANQRTLERTFIREMGMTPQQYIAVRRLNAVRRRLIALDKEQGLGVTDIALSHGFTHLGRFAGDYHRQFGEYPRETLRAR